MSYNNILNHLLLLTPGFPKDEEDSTCIPALQVFIKHLAERKTIKKISIITLHYPFERKTYFWNGLEITSIGGANKKGINRVFYWQRMLKEIKRINALSKIDLIHTFWLSEVAILGQFYAKRNNIPHTVTLMGQDVLKSNKFHKFVTVAEANCIALSENQKNEWKRNFGKKAEKIIPWGVESNKNSNISIPKTIDFINIGSLISLKNQTLFIDVIAFVKKKFPSVRALIIGDGVDKKKLQNLIFVKDLQDNITLTGELSNEMTLKHLSQSKVMIHTSIYESYGFVFNEAMSLNVPIVSFDVGIAKASNYWKIAKSNDDFFLSTLEMYTHLPEETQLKEVNSISNTCQEYEAWWSSKIPHLN